MSLARAHVLLTVAARPNVSVAEIAESLKLSQTSASRHVSMLGTTGRVVPKTGELEAGLGLLEAQEDPDDRRTKRVLLRPEGVKLLKRIAARMT